MADYQDEFKRILDKELGDYAAQALALLAAAIQAKGLVLTEDLLDSLSSQVVAASAEHVASMGVLFHQYGRIKDMKGISRTKAPPIEALEGYVKKVDLSKFSYVPGYKYGQFPLASSTALNRIAWGLARAKLRDKDEVTTHYVASTGTR